MDDLLWCPADRYIGTCCMCSREGLKRNMVALYAKRTTSPMRKMCDVCDRCLPDLLDRLEVSMPV